MRQYNSHLDFKIVQLSYGFITSNCNEDIKRKKYVIRIKKPTIGFSRDFNNLRNNKTIVGLYGSFWTIICKVCQYFDKLIVTTLYQKLKIFMVLQVAIFEKLL